MTTTTTTITKLGDDHLDDARERWNRDAQRHGRDLAADARWDAENPRRIVLSNINGDLGAYVVTDRGELRLERADA